MDELFGNQVENSRATAAIGGGSSGPCSKPTGS